MRNITSFTLFLPIFLAVSGCAKDAAQVRPMAANPAPYMALSCAQLSQEADKLERDAAISANLQDQRASNDKMMVGMGLFLFAPMALMTKGDDRNTVELSDYKGKLDTIASVSDQKHCGITIAPITAAPSLDPADRPAY